MSSTFGEIHNKKNKLRISCDEIDAVITKRIKSYLSGNQIFENLVEQELKKRLSHLPKIDSEIHSARQQLQEIKEGMEGLKTDLLSKNRLKSD